jgi:hypothetical protein
MTRIISVLCQKIAAAALLSALVTGVLYAMTHLVAPDYTQTVSQTVLAASLSIVFIGVLFTYPTE